MVIYVQSMAPWTDGRANHFKNLDITSYIS
jgi:hypothetical protein